MVRGFSDGQHRPRAHDAHGFVFDVLESDDATRTMQIALRPDPRRYEAYEKGGKTYYRDRYLGFHYGPEVIAQMAQKMAGTPVHYLAPSVENSEDYAAIRREAVRHEISTGEYIAPEEDADEHQSLSPNARRAM